jgi:hypothetical protein
MSKNIIIKDKRYLEKMYLVRYGKQEVESNPKENQIIKIEKYSNWKNQLPVIVARKTLIDKNGVKINPYYYETFEQYLILKYIKPNDIVLEIGARYGIVSNTINLLLDNKKNHIVVEPDLEVIPA